MPGPRVQGLGEGTRRQEGLEDSEGEEGIGAKCPFLLSCAYQGWGNRAMSRPSRERIWEYAESS